MAFFRGGDRCYHQGIQAWLNNMPLGSQNDKTNVIRADPSNGSHQSKENEQSGKSSKKSRTMPKEAKEAVKENRAAQIALDQEHTRQQ